LINKKIFRQYDIRGIIDKDLREDNTKLIGYFLGQTIQAKTIKNAYVVVGYDMRTHSKLLFEALVSGLNYSGCKVINIGLVATGVNYFASYQDLNINNQIIKANASVMITGSHNSKEFNGFKTTINNEPFFADELIKLHDKIIENKELNIPDNLNSLQIDAKKLYIDYMIKEFSHLKNLKQDFVIDCGNGAANTVICDILNALNLNYKALYTTPNGEFPNHHPDPSKEENLQDLKNELKNSYNLGFAYDGDADRIAVLTQKHNIKGDSLALLFSKTMKNPIIIGEVTYSQNILDQMSPDTQAIMDKTGYSNLRLKLKELNADLAAEVSGHIFFNDRYYGFDDAIYATLRVLELVHLGINIDEEIDKIPKVYTSENIELQTLDENKFIIVEKIKEKVSLPIRDFPVIKDIIHVDGIRIVFEYGWALVRASNTNALLVTKYEASSYATAMTYKNSLEKIINEVENELNITSDKNY